MPVVDVLWSLCVHVYNKETKMKDLGRICAVMVVALTSHVYGMISQSNLDGLKKDFTKVGSYFKVSPSDASDITNLDNEFLKTFGHLNSIVEKLDSSFLGDFEQVNLLDGFKKLTVEMYNTAIVMVYTRKPLLHDAAERCKGLRDEFRRELEVYHADLSTNKLPQVLGLLKASLIGSGGGGSGSSSSSGSSSILFSDADDQ
ncbi:hypothetical protein FACS189449_05210 [Alphaproteobacteria bacterium]|nr:hypothetical protein FACS189449_05210 [Alphaproteobacteria bacterium]